MADNGHDHDWKKVRYPILGRFGQTIGIAYKECPCGWRKVMLDSGRVETSVPMKVVDGLIRVKLTSHEISRMSTE